MDSTQEFYRGWVDLYDRMIDWPKRLAAEGPLLTGQLNSADARRVLDVACGTGRHLAWLADAGFDVAGADVSAEMLQRARDHLGPSRDVPLFNWSMADAVPDDLASAEPFDAILCLGNSLPHLLEDSAVSAALGNFRRLLRPGGLLLLGLKALAVMQARREHSLAPVKRATDDGELLFARFYDFAADGEAAADFHLVIIGPQASGSPAGRILHHAANRLRAWWPGPLGAAVLAAGFERVQVARDLGATPWTGPADGADIFLTAHAPA